MVAASEDDEVVRQTVAETRSEAERRRQSICEEFIRLHGLQLCPGITLQDMTHTLMGIAERLSPLRKSSPQPVVIDDTRRCSLYSSCVIAFFRRP
jgi:hypothetical protein